MVLACVCLAIAAGVTAYFTLPKEGSPDIEIPAFFVSVFYPGISAEDSERLLVEPLEARLSQVKDLKEIYATAADGYAGVSLHFEFGIDKPATLADIRDRLDRAQSEFPDGTNKATVTEFSIAEFPIIVVVLSGAIAERMLMQVGEEIRDRLESLPGILEVNFSGMRKEMVEVIIDPLQLEAYNVSADELITVINRNNQLVAAGQVETEQGAFSLRIPSSFDDPWDVQTIPIKVNGDRVVTVGDVSEVRMTFEDRSGFSRHNTEPTIAMQVVKRKGTNIIDSAENVRATVEAVRASWPEQLQKTVKVEFAQDQSRYVDDMVTQLESSVLTAVALVMIVVIATLGTRSALLVGFAIPTSFLLCFALLAVMSISVSNIVMFGLILAVGMLVDSAIVIVELADRRVKEGLRPTAAFASAAKRMFWPIISSTATTLCAFLPMLFWPGMAGQFMGTLPMTIIFVLSASLLVALIFLPVVGGVSGQLSLQFAKASARFSKAPILVKLIALALVIGLMMGSALLILNPGALPALRPASGSIAASVPGALLFAVSSCLLSIVFGSIRTSKRQPRITGTRKRTPYGWIMQLLVGNPVMPVVCVLVAFAAVAMTIRYYGENNYGVEFFVDAEPDRVQVFVRARGNLSLHEKDLLVREVENAVVGIEGIFSVFSFTGSESLNRGFGGARPSDTIGTLQIEFDRWEERQKVGGIVADTRQIIELMETRLSDLPGIHADIQVEQNGPSQGKPLQLRLTSHHWEELVGAVGIVRNKMDSMKGISFVEDTRPLPGIDWRIDVDVEEAGRFGTDISTIGAMIQMVTRGILLGTMRVDSSDEEIDIRVRFPESDRHLSTLDELRLRSPNGLVPISNFVSRTPVAKIGQISRFDQSRYIDIRADVDAGLTNEEGKPITPTERIGKISQWLETEAGLPENVRWSWTGDQDAQAESQKFLMQAFIGALGLMFAVLLAQFNSFYSAVLVLVAVVLSTAGVLGGLLFLQEPFSIIMTGVGIIALAGIVVNNNIVLIDTYQEYARIMPRLEALVRTTEVRIRPVVLTSVTTIAGLLPMMLGFAIDVVQGGYIVDTPSSLWWKQLASAVVFGLSTATVLTLVVTPSLLAIPIWAKKGSYRFARLAAATAAGKNSRYSRDLRLARALKQIRSPTIAWDTDGWHTDNLEDLPFDADDTWAEELPDSVADVVSIESVREPEDASPDDSAQRERTEDTDREEPDEEIRAAE